VLWDTKTKTIVNNESSEIIRLLNSEFDTWGDASIDLYPHDLAPEIDALNAKVYETVNNGVYRAGFATSQAVYDAAVLALFATLEELEQRLADRRYLLGSRLTEADVRLFTMGVRFDLVYYSHFKCNIKQWRFPKSFQLVEGCLPAAGDRANGGSWRNQAPLLSQHALGKSERHCSAGSDHRPARAARAPAARITPAILNR